MAADLTNYETARHERTHTRPVFTPSVDIYETPENIVVLADMPGVDEKHVDLTLEKNVLTIEGRVPHDERRGWHLVASEHALGDFRRAFTLSSEVDRERITASMEHGVLRLTLPKSEPAKTRKITVKAS